MEINQIFWEKSIEDCILELVKNKTNTISKIAKKLNISDETASKHLRRLKNSEKIKYIIRKKGHSRYIECKMK